jgi:dienelactone hydrolase
VAEIVLFHSALGPRPGVAVAAARLRAGGHTVHTPDLFRGHAFFDQAEPAVDYCRRELGLPGLMARARMDVEALPSQLVYAGFSLGATFAATLAATRPGARAAILLSGAPAPEALPVQAWPASVPVQLHRMTGDRWVDPASLAHLAEFVAASGAAITVYDYPGSGHLFADPDLPDFDPSAADLMWRRVLELLARIDERPPGARAGGQPG